MRTLLIACTLLGCGGDDGGRAQMDAAPLPACTGAAYDLCTDVTNSSDCTGGATCHEFATQGYTECSPSCSTTTPCPNDKNNNPVSCNMMGRCRAEPNACM